MQDNTIISFVIMFLILFIMFLYAKTKSAEADQAAQEIKRLRESCEAELKTEKDRLQSSGFVEMIRAENIIKDHDNEQMKKLEQQQLDLRKDLEEIEALFNACYGRQMLFEVCGAYPRDDIGPDNLPRSNDNSGTRWGEKYTFYISYNQRAETRYHRPSCRYAGRSSINAYEIEQDRRHVFIPCKVCSPQLPDLVWYHTYLKLYNFKRKYM